MAPFPRTVLAAALAAILAAGCGAPETPGTVVTINGPDPETLDPALATGLEDLRVIAGIYEGLTRCDPVTAAAIPGLAERWEISPDGRTYVFHLRDGLQWASGHPITADDVVCSWRRVLDPRTASEYAAQLFYLRNAAAYNSGQITNAAMVGVSAPDGRTVRVELENPTPYFLDLCAFQTLAVVPRYLVETNSDHWQRPPRTPSSGPFLLESWRLNDRIRLVKNPFYWDAANTKAPAIEFLAVTAADTALNLYMTGQADVIWDRNSLPPELLDVLRQKADYHSFALLGTYFIRCNTTKPPFNDSRVRRALAQAIDKRRLVAKFLGGGEPAADRLVPPGTAHYEQAPDGLEFDRGAARRLLAAAGFPNGENFPPFTYSFDAGPGGVNEKIAVELQQSWIKELGLRPQLRQMEKRVMLAAQTRLDYDLSRGTWIGDYNDPNTFLDLFSSGNGNNRTGWKNTNYDALLGAAAREPDAGARGKLLAEAESLLVREEMPVIPLFFDAGLIAYDGKKIKGIHTNLLDIHPLNAIWKTGGNPAARTQATSSPSSTFQ